MSDFASAAMLRLIHKGLQQQGLQPPSPGPPRGARVALDAKRALAQALWQAHGPDVLVRIGGAARDGHEPLMAALAPARDPPDLVCRWQRLEQFIHSRHRISMLPIGANSMHLQHVSTDRGAAPLPAEDLLVFGLLIALLERCGTRELQARLVGERRWRWTSAHWVDRPWPQQLGAWELRWAERDAPPVHTPPTPGRDWPARVRQHLDADLSRDWQLASLARDLQTSARSLQRQLAAARTGFSSLLAEQRAGHAAALLLAGRSSLAEIGYLCGYADQAHFTREFQRHTAQTPARFRQRFSTTG